MAFYRSTEIDITRPDADDEHDAVMELDADLTAAFSNLNTMTTAIGTKMGLDSIGSASGICDLDEDALVPETRIPTYPTAKLPILLGYPVGAIVPCAAGVLASGMSGIWAECNGASVSTTTYADLHAVIGTLYGSAGSGYMNLPDVRGIFPRGWDHGKGVDIDSAARTDSGNGTTGDAVGTLQASQNKMHTHDLLSRTSALDNGDGSAGTEYFSPGSSGKTDVLKAYGGTKWESGASVSVGDEVVATTWNGKKYSCTKAGTTDSTEPTWASYAVGDTVPDGTAKWLVELSSLAEFRPPNITAMFIIRIA